MGKGKEITKEQFLKQNFYKNGNWSKKRVKEYFGSYSGAYIEFYNVYRDELPSIYGGLMVPKKSNKQIKAFMKFLYEKTFYTNKSLLHIFNKKIQLIDGVDKVKMAQEMIEFKTKYLDTSNEDFFFSITKIIAHGLTSGTLKQYLKDDEKE